VKEQFDDIAAAGETETQREAMLRSVLMINGNKEYVIRSILNSERGPEELSAELLSKITKPVKLIWGGQDETVPLKYGMLLNRELPGSTIDIIDAAGHEPHYDQPEKVKDAIVGFVAKAAGRS
jgi:pimeloyl-ACP methyl ester carboxylesterase